MKDYQKYNNKLFSRWAPVYDGFEIFLSHVRKEMAQEISPTNKTVLDVATGTGSLALVLSATAKSLVGIDLSAKMLDVANKKTKNDKLSFLQMDASKMSFLDNEFDVVTISLGLHDMPLEVRTLVLEEVKRVLKKDGKLYILEHDSPTYRFLRCCSAYLMNLFESKYYLEFIAADLEAYLTSLGFKIERKTNYIFGHLQFLALTH